MTPDQIKQFVSNKANTKALLESQLGDKQDIINKSKLLVTNLIEARSVIAEVSKTTQGQFKEYVESLVTTAIQAVFPNENYKFLAEYAIKNNRSEINLLVQQDDKEPYLPEDEQGGALLDLISFALRVVLWSLESPRSVNTFIMDEPFRFCGKLTSLAGKMMSEISHKLNLQMILVTHSDDLIEIADRSWFVSRDENKISVVRNSQNPPEVKQKIRRRR